MSSTSKPLAAGACIAALAALLLAMSPAPRKFIGSVHIYGSEPHTYVGLQDESDGKVYALADGEKESELRGLQGKRVEFSVKTGEPRAYPPSDGTVTVISYKILD
jgi:hypothetical protein